MFVQVMEGRVGDAKGLRSQLEAWMSDLQPGADGWLGTTAGITADGNGPSSLHAAWSESHQGLLASSCNQSSPAGVSFP